MAERHDVHDHEVMNYFMCREQEVAADRRTFESSSGRRATTRDTTNAPRCSGDPTPLTPAPAKRRPYVPTGRKPGRPKGSRNRPKPPEAQVPVVRPHTLQVARAARYADVSVSTMRKWIREGHVRVKRIGSLVLVLVDSLDAFLGYRGES
jgi:excisionase family DNA binding protein